jgi:hypothetical protein
MVGNQTRNLSFELRSMSSKSPMHSASETNLRHIGGMFRDYSATLDVAIKLADAPRNRKIDGLSA